MLSSNLHHEKAFCCSKLWKCLDNFIVPSDANKTPTKSSFHAEEGSRGDVDDVYHVLSSLIEFLPPKMLQHKKYQYLSIRTTSSSSEKEWTEATNVHFARAKRFNFRLPLGRVKHDSLSDICWFIDFLSGFWIITFWMESRPPQRARL